MGYSLNLATGQNAQGVIQDSGDLPDANWAVTNADNYLDAPIAYTVAPNDADWSHGPPAWSPNNAKSAWIAADPNVSANGNMTFTLKFNLTGYNPSGATISNGMFSIDDQGSVYLNGHLLSSGSSITQFVDFSDGAGDFVSGWNTIVVQGVDSDNYLEGMRLQGTVVDNVREHPGTSATWTSAVNGSFVTSKDWSTGSTPGTANDALLQASGANYTVTSTVAETVNSLQMASNATLSISAGTFTATYGSDVGTDDGTIAVADGASFAAGEYLANAGLIKLGYTGTAGSAQFVVLSSGLTLTGSGSVSFKDTTAASFAEITGGPLENSGNTLVGKVYVDVGKFTNDAGSVVDATAADQSALIAESGGTPGGMVNAGLIESSGPTTSLATPLIISCNLLDNAGGVISAAAGSAIGLGGVATLSGGTLSGGGVIDAGASASGSVRDVFDGRTSTLVNEASVVIASGDLLTLSGAIDNEGTFYLDNAGASSSYLEVGEVGTTLTGSGRILMTDNSHNLITTATAGEVLDNTDNAISGAGQIGQGLMGLQNAGLIDASGTNALIVDTGTYSFTNTGKLEGTGSGGLVIRSSTVNGGGGTILAANGSLVTLESSQIEGGTLASLGTGTVRFTGSGDALNGSTSAVEMSGEVVDPAGILVTGEGTLDLAGKLYIKGTANFEGALVDTGQLNVSGSATIEGAVSGGGYAILTGGTLTLGAGFDGKAEFDPTGSLVLAQAQDFTGEILRFSKTGTTSLDLETIAYVSASEASYSGTSSSGVLTVTDGTNTAKLTLEGNYLDVIFTAASDGRGGVTVTAGPPPAGPAGAEPTEPTHSSPAAPLAQAIAAFAPNRPALTNLPAVALDHAGAAAMLVRPA